MKVVTYWFKPNLHWNAVPEYTYYVLFKAGYSKDFLKITVEEILDTA